MHSSMHQYLLRISGIAAAVALCGAMAASPVLALGIGKPTVNPVIGRPLRIEIPLQLAAGEALPKTGCAHISLPHGAADKQLFPTNAYVEIDTAGAPKVVIASSRAVGEPVLEFRLTVGCNNELSREYLILSDPPPAEAQAPERSPAEAAVTPIAATSPPATETRQPEITSVPSPPAVSGPVASTPAAAGMLRVAKNTNLNALARQRYPESQAARIEYQRLMAQANPALFADKEKIEFIPIASGTVLAIPQNLPPPEKKRVDQAASASSVVRVPRKPAGGSSPSAVPAPSKDRLVLSSDLRFDSKTMNSRQMSASIERMERMIEDQGRTAVNIAESLYTLNLAYAEAKNHIQTLEATQKKAVEEQRALQLRVERAEASLEKAPGIWELLALIVASGGIGAGLLTLHHRLNARRERVQVPFWEDAGPAAEKKVR